VAGDDRVRTTGGAIAATGAAIATSARSRDVASVRNGPRSRRYVRPVL